MEYKTMKRPSRKFEDRKNTDRRVSFSGRNSGLPIGNHELGLLLWFSCTSSVACVQMNGKANR